MGNSEQESPATTDIYLIHDDTLETGPLAGLAPGHRLVDLQWEQRSTPPAGARVFLSLGDDRIRDLTPLAGMTSLQWLFLGDNQISDISPLSGLTSLTNLYLSRNHEQNKAVF